MKRFRTVLVPVGVFALLLAPACGDDDSGTPDVPHDTADAGDGDVSTSGVLYETCPTTCAVEPSCTRTQIETCCTCIERPTGNVGRTPCGVMSEYCDEAPADPVNVACLKPDGWPDPPPASPPTVTVRGIVDVYGSGPMSAGGDITVEIYRMGLDGSIDGAAIDVATATQASCDPDQLPPLREDGDEADCCPGPCQELDPNASDCTATSGDCRPLWLYQLENVPTSTPLILHTSGDPTFWKDLYYSNVFFFTTDVVAGEYYVFYKAKTLSVDDYNAIPASAGDFDGIAAGQGAVAGEIHDCDNVKLFNAQVGVWPEAGTFSYFNGVEAKPYPDTLRSSTNTDGLYAALEVPPGQTRISAIGQVEGEGLVSFGWWDAHVFPDALTVVTIRGTRPTQVPTP